MALNLEIYMKIKCMLLILLLQSFNTFAQDSMDEMRVLDHAKFAFPLVRVISNPSDFDHKTVSVKGYVKIGKPWHVYYSIEDCMLGAYQNSLYFYMADSQIEQFESLYDVSEEVCFRAGLVGEFLMNDTYGKDEYSSYYFGISGKIVNVEFY